MDNNTDIKDRRKPELDIEFRADTDRPATRHCMSCHKVFMSEGWHNRLCKGCRSISDPFV